MDLERNLTRETMGTPSPSPVEGAGDEATGESRGRAGDGPPLYVALLALLGAFLRFGYVYGVGDQDELIPSVLHLLDPSLFTQDWLVQTITSGVNVRTYFLWAVALPSAVAGRLPPLGGGIRRPRLRGLWPRARARP